MALALCSAHCCGCYRNVRSWTLVDPCLYSLYCLLYTIHIPVPRHFLWFYRPCNHLHHIHALHHLPPRNRVLPRRRQIQTSPGRPQSFHVLRLATKIISVYSVRILRAVRPRDASFSYTHIRPLPTLHQGISSLISGSHPSIHHCILNRQILSLLSQPHPSLCAALVLSCLFRAFLVPFRLAIPSFLRHPSLSLDAYPSTSYSEARIVPHTLVLYVDNLLRGVLGLMLSFIRCCSCCACRVTFLQAIALSKFALHIQSRIIPCSDLDSEAGTLHLGSR